MDSTLEDAMDDIEDERELLGNDLRQTADDVEVGTGFSPDAATEREEGVSEDA